MLKDSEFLLVFGRLHLWALQIISGNKMGPNLNEFLGMVGIVTNATLFILIFRWGIHRLGVLEASAQQNKTQTDNAK